METQVTDLPPPVDLTQLEARLTDGDAALSEVLASLGADLAGQIAEISARLTDMDARLSDVERLPTAEGEFTEGAVAAYEREVAALREEISAQQARMQALADDAAAQLQAVQDETAAAQADAEAAAREAAIRAAVARIETALGEGAPFGDALAELEAVGVAPDPALTAGASEGVPTLATLQEGFPDAARAALSAVRDAGEAGEGAGIRGFLRNQLNVRSVAPREGEEPDAVLSRVQAAVTEGRLADALGELGALPDSAAAPLSVWAETAAQRVGATSALDTLLAELNEN